MKQRFFASIIFAIHLILAGDLHAQCNCTVGRLTPTSISLPSGNGYYRYNASTHKVEWVINGVTQNMAFESGTLTGTGSANRIPYWTSASALSFGPYWDNTNGRLGIGASTPSYRIHAEHNQNGTSSIAVTNSDATNSNSRAQLLAVSNTVEGAVLAINGDGTYIGSSSNHITRIMSNGSTKLSVNPSGVVNITTTPTNDNTNTSILTLDGSGNVETKNDVVDGSGANTRISFWTDANTVSSDADLTYNSTLNKLTTTQVELDDATINQDLFLNALSNVNANTSILTLGSGNRVETKDVTSIIEMYRLTSVAIDFTNTAAHTTSTAIDVTVTGASVGDHVIVSPVSGVLPQGGVAGFVSGANNVKVVFHNITTSAVDPVSSNYNVLVIKH